jgi:hypothetical protein
LIGAVLAGAVAVTRVTMIALALWGIVEALGLLGMVLSL